MSLSDAEKLERNRIAVRKHYNANKEKRAEKNRSWAKRNPEHRKALQLRGNLKYAYGITPEQRAALLAAHDGFCAVCGINDPGPKGWCIDHDHTLEKGLDSIRGIVCTRCNLSLGFNGDEISKIEATCARQIDYLQKFQDQRKLRQARSLG